MGKDLSRHFHPVRTGSSIALGDYGYFDKDTGVWHRLGNICNIPGMRFSPTIQTSDDRYSIVIQSGVAIKASSNVGADFEGVKAKCSVSFGKDQNYYVRGEICKLEEYSSVAVEIKDQIEKLKKVGRWASNYRVITTVAYSSSFFSLFAAQSGGGVDLSANVESSVPFQEIDANVGLSGSVNKTSVEFVNKINDGSVSPIGFKTIELRSGIPVIGKSSVKFVGEELDSSEIEDGSHEKSQDPIVYN